ncbi:hypothetical protein [Paracoccus endophyticus]|uniref:hypothetical protein n=1 Tax=Paracoccus endophyticus TaxID=2233774 RepID=UPI000DDAACDC|nr:hypothetical protein [Paracoccus endophyticus]
MRGDFTSLGLKSGVWEGVLTDADRPGRVALVLHGRTLVQAQVIPDGEGRFRIAAALPAGSMAEGAQTYLLIADDGEGDEGPRPGATRLGAMPVIAGAALDEDLRAEIELLRAEVDLLKREFRRLATA